MQFSGLHMLEQQGRREREVEPRSLWPKALWFRSFWHMFAVLGRERYKTGLFVLALFALVLLTSRAGLDGINRVQGFIVEQAFSSMTLDQLHFAGLAQTNEENLLQVLAGIKDTPMLGLDLEQIKAEVELLPWVETATVSRQYPDNLFVHIIERTPYALWQENGEVWLIDAGGAKITQSDLGQYFNMPFLVGAGAPEHFAALENILSSVPSLSQKVDALVWVGDRRWDVMFTSGARLRLPEVSANYSPKQAWQRFGQLNRDHQLLSREVAVFDMRLSDRMIVTLTERGETLPSPRGAEI